MGGTAVNKQDAALLRRVLGEEARDAVENLCGFFGCGPGALSGFSLIPAGMTNRSFVFSFGGERYVYRHPGSGPERGIDRAREKRSLERAAALGLDPSFLFADAENGWKLSRCVPDFRLPDYDSPEDSVRVAAALRRLHAEQSPDIGLRPWEDAEALEREIGRLAPEKLEALAPLGEALSPLYAEVKGDGVAPCFCHGDAYRNNWMLTPQGETLLIDWEYAGQADPGVDTGYYILDACWGPEESDAFLRLYLGEAYSERLRRHHLIYAALVGRYWVLWAQHRLLCGTDTADYLARWKDSTERWIHHLTSHN